MTTPLRVDGADISHHQRTVDLREARQAGLKFLYHKATEGDSWVDARYAERRKAAELVGLPFGAYHFARPSGSDAILEARHFLKIADPKPGDLLPVLDLEDTGGLGRAALTAWARAFRDEVVRQTGVLPMIYTPFDLGSDLGCRLWVARYSNSNAEPRVPAPWGTYDLRQFSNGVYGVPKSFPGLGNVDLNTFGTGRSLSDFRIPNKEPIVSNRFSMATHNILYKLDSDRWMEDFKKSGKASVVLYQECESSRAKATLRRWAAANQYDTYTPAETGNVFSWDRRVWKPVHTLFRGVVEVHGSARDMGLTSKFPPARDFSYLGLEHIATGQRFLFINVHPASGATRPESSPRHKEGDALTRHRDWAFAQYWLDIIAFVARELSHEHKPNRYARLWDGVLLGGDFNASLESAQRWYYPAQILRSLFNMDTDKRGLDHLMRAHGSDLKPVGRRSVAAHTDHRIHFADWEVRERADQPRHR